MRTVLEFIESRVNEQGKTPFIQWLHDDSVPCRDRLSLWYYSCARFAFDFADLNNMIMRYPEAELEQDPLKRAINNHTDEDGKHWPMYLSDLKNLGLDKQMNFSDALKFLWGKETFQQRKAFYRMCQLASQNEHPILRYCIMESTEMFGHFLFKELAHISAQFTRETGIELHYLGPTHFVKEPGHLANQEDNTEENLWNITLESSMREKTLLISSEVCDLIEARWHEFYQVSNQSLQKQLVAV